MFCNKAHCGNNDDDDNHVDDDYDQNNDAISPR